MNQQNKALKTFKYYWRHMRRYPRQIIGVLVSVPLTMLVNIFLPSLILADVLSRLGSHDYIDGEIIASFGPQLIAYSVLLLAGVGAWRLVDHFAWKLEANVSKDVAEEVFDDLIHKSANFHANNFSGSLVSNTNKILSSYIRIADSTIFQTYPLVVNLILASVIMAGRAPVYVIALIVLSVGFLTVAMLGSRPVRRMGAIHAASESRQTGYLADAIGNVMVVKSFARSHYENKRFASATAESRRTLYDFVRVQRRQMNYLGLSSRVISIAALVLAVVSALTFNSDIGTVFLIFSISAGIASDLFGFSNNSLRSYNRAIGDSSHMIDLLATPPEVIDPIKPEKSHIKSGDIVFDDVTFQHDGSDDAIFDNLNVQIKHGEKVGLVGHSGSGKTTFTRVLQRFSDIDGGEIRIDGQNIAKITQDDLHSVIAYVPQEPLLFHRTIAENISYGNPDASRDDIVKIAKQANAHEFIATLPEGFDTLVGERGVKLSGGQRQRIAIARAMLKDAPILVLDEATSALDSESEGLIQEALWKLMEGRTAIAIAHRLSTIQHMDRIIVLDNGAIVEQGSHKELVKAGGTYARLWSHQSGGFIDD